MTVETDTERTAYLADFGTTITKADASTFTAIFENQFIEAGGAIREVESANPVLICRSTDVSDLVHDSVLTFNSSTFHVIGIEPDGTGMTYLQLEKQ